MKSLRLALAALGLASGAAHADANLLLNGGFETGSFSSWVVELGDDTTFVDYGPRGSAVGDASDGRFLAFFGSTQVSGGSFISQTVATVPGRQYVLGFALANDNAGAAASNAFSVWDDGKALFAATQLATQGPVFESLVFTALGTTSTPRFGGYNDSGYVQLDAVGLAVAPVPEPATSVLLIAGLGGLLLSRRARRSRAAG